MNILMLGVGKDQLIAIREAVDLGIGVIGFDGNDNAVGFEHCDYHEVVDISKQDDVEQRALYYNKKYGIDGVIAPAVEVGPSVGRVVDSLGLLGIGEQTALDLSDKLRRRSLLDDIYIRQPKWHPNNKVKDRWKMFPAVIKPCDCAGAKGVMKVNNMKQVLEQKFDLIEEYIDGWEISTEVLVLSNGYPIMVHADRNYDKKHKWPPYLIEDGCQLPSKLPPLMKQKINNVVYKIVNALNLRSCVIKLDIVIKDNLVYVLEAAPRLGGGKLSSEMIPKAYGINWWKVAIKLAMGMPIEREEIVPQHSKFVAQRYRFPDKVTSHYDRLEDTIAEGNSYEQAIQNTEKLRDTR